MSDRTRKRLREAVERHRETLAEAKSIMTASAYGRERLNHFVGGDARHCLSCCGNGAPTGVPVSRSDRADCGFGRPGHAGAPGTDPQASPTRLNLDDDDPIGRELSAARARE